MKKKWVVKELKNEVPNLPEYPALILRLLALRGIVEPEAIKEFLDPTYEKLHDPFLFVDMQKAVERISKAITEKEKILIYSDYDADAITALSVVYLALKKAGAVLDYYIPDRFSEGYGMNVEAIKSIKERDVKVIITVDCGINAVEEANVAKELGMELIVTDHHELTGELPDAVAIINPKNPKDNYPFTYLTGVGVAYKLIQALYSKIEIAAGFEKWLLDLVAIGTVTDCQSLSGENRILVSFGLKVLAKTKWPGLKALLEVALAKQPYDAFTLGFVLGPRINAAGRIKHADLAFKLLIAENDAEAKPLALELDALNKQRQILTEQILSEARSQIEIISGRKILLAAGTDWPKGVVGLVAGKLSEEFNKPVLILNKSEDLATGSARSVETFDILAALGFASEYLMKYGGHTQAAGFTLKSENLDKFYEKLLQYADQTNFQNEDPILKLDVELVEADVSFDTAEFLEAFAPFGFGNPRPKFMSKNFELIDASAVGNAQNHAKMRVRLGNSVFSAIAFNQAYLLNKIKPNQKFDAAYELTQSEWNGMNRIDLKIIDVQINE